MKSTYQSTLFCLFLLPALIFVSGCVKPQIDAVENSAPTAQPLAPQTSDYLIGSYTKTEQQGVYRVTLDHKTGGLSGLTLVAASKNPSYLIWRAADQLMFVVNETGAGGVSSFKWDATAALFNPVASKQQLGAAPCFIAASPDQAYFAVANYMSGDVQLFSQDADGQFALKNSQRHIGRGKHARQEAPHPHWINWSPNGKYIYAVDLGLDQLLRYEMVGGKLANRSVALKTNPADGPRHMVFHPQLNKAYLLNELSNTVVVLALDESQGEVSVEQRLSTLEPAYAKHNQAAAIKISPDGRFLYTSNRGANTIASFSVNELGALEYIEQVATAGRWPRDFILSSDGGRHLLVANSGSNAVNVLQRDPATGRLQLSEAMVEVHQPTVLVEF